MKSSNKQLKLFEGMLVTVLLLFVHSLSAQISLTSTGGATTGSYTTLKAAFDAINSGTHTGDILIKVEGSTTETATCRLDSSGVSTGANYTSVLIVPSDTATVPRVIDIAISGSPLIDLNGADNVFIDGRSLSGGNNRLLTFRHSNSNSSTTSIVLRCINGVRDAVIQYTNLVSLTTTATAASINLNLSTSVATTGNRNITVHNNNITGGIVGVSVAGTLANFMDSIYVLKNIITNAQGTSLAINGVRFAIVDSNIISHTASFTGWNLTGISINPNVSAADYRITRNVVANLQTGSTAQMAGVLLSPGTAGLVIVPSVTFVNNSISLLATNSAITFARAMQFQGTNPANVTCLHNTFRLGGSGAGTTGNPASITFVKSNSSALTSFTFNNNICINTRTGAANPHIGYWNTTPTTGTNTTDWNLLHGAVFSAIANGFFQGTVAGYRTASAPNEQNSTFGNLDFVNNLYPDLTVGGLNNTGAKLMGNPSAVTTDIYLTARSSTSPYKGAFEGSSSNLTTNDLQTVIIYTYGKIPVGTTDTVRALIRNNGAAAAVNVPINLFSSKSGYIGAVNISLPVGGEQIINVAPYTPGNLGVDTLFVYPAPDQVAANDTARWIRENTLNALSYNNITLPQSGNVGTNGQGEIVAKFFTPVPNFLNQVNVNFTNIGFTVPNPFQVVLYEDSGATFGPKRTPLWVSTTQNTVNGIFNLSIPNVQVSGNFYIGVRQTSANNIGFAFQNENPIRDRTFYFRQDGTGTAGVYLTSPWNDFAVNPNNQFRFMIEPRLKINDDLGVVSLVAPGEGCVNPGSQQVRVLIQNLGLLSQNFAVDTLRVFGRIIKPSGATFNYGPFVISSGLLASDDTLSVVLANNFLMDTLGTYSFTAWTRLGPDNNRLNDTLPLVQRNLVASATAPLYESFNASAVFPNNWTTNRFFVSANNGVGASNSARVNIDGANNFTANAYMQSPRLSGITANTALRFDYRILNNIGGTPASFTANDSIKVLVSTDCGLTYTQAGLITAATHPVSGDFRTAQFSLSTFNGSDIVVRIVYDWFGTTNNVIVDMDNVRFVQVNNDAGANNINICRAISVGASSFAPEVSISNRGTSALTNIPVNVSITGPVNYNGTATVASLGTGASTNVILTSLFNPNTAGTYTVKAWTSLTGDGDALNDTAYYTFNVVNMTATATQLNQGTASGSGINFGGSSRLSVANSATLNITNALTIESWINAVGTGRRTIVSKDSVTGFLQYELLVNANNLLEFNLFTSTAYHSLLSRVNVPAGFTHVAATFDGSTARLLINGNIVMDTVLAASTILPQNYGVTIGNSNDATTAFLGTIDEVRIWNVARTPNQIRINMHTRLANAANANLVAHYRFDEGFGNNFATDVSGNCNTALFSIIAPAWATVTYPFGTPTVQTQVIFADGSYNFTGTGVTVEYTGFAGTDSLYLVRFNGQPIGTSPITNPGGVTAVHPNYWLYYRYGTGTSTTLDLNVSFGAGNLNAGVQTTDLRLFNRANGANGAWTQLYSSASTVNFASQSAKFALTPAIYGTQFAIGAVNNPLPVTWVDFSAKHTDNHALLTWSVAAEKNNKGYFVERSIDGVSFEEIDFVNGKGDHTYMTSYTYTDYGVFMQYQTAYYRLRQVDFNGKFTYSKTIMLTASIDADVISSVYPNPMNNQLNIELGNVAAEKVTLNVFDVTGKLVQMVEIPVNNGKLIQTNELSGLHSGIYMLQITHQNKLVYQTKLIKTN